MAVIVGDGDDEAVGPKVVRCRGVAPGAGGGVDRRHAMAGSRADGEVRCAGPVLGVGKGQGAGDRRVFVTGLARVAAEGGGIVNRRYIELDLDGVIRC